MSYLKAKAEDNYKIAKIAEQKECFDVAVSRYYYYIYQNIMDFLIRETKPDNFNYNHKETISNFIKYFKDQGSYESHRDLVKLWSLKDRRHESDYKNDKRIINSDEFEKIFKRDFNDVNRVFSILQII